MHPSANGVEGCVALLPFPALHNACALTPDQAAAFAEDLRRFDADPRVRAIVIDLTSAPTAVFAPSDPAAKPAAAIAAAVTPTIAAITQDCFDQRLEAALACDVRIADANARFAIRHVPNGALPSDGGAQRLTRIVGRGRVLYMLLTGEAVGAADAMRMGLVEQVVPAGGLSRAAAALAGAIANGAPVAAAYAKEAVHAGADLTLAQSLVLEHDLSVMLHSTRDRAEGLRAFAERRVPRFEGQ